jgi:hypothetical protein
VNDAASTKQIMKWRWAGRVVRLDHRRWAHATALWDPRNGLRGPGRPSTRRTDDMKIQDGKPMDQNREEQERFWKKYEEVIKVQVYESSRHR